MRDNSLVRTLLSPETRRGLRQQVGGRQNILKHREWTMKIRLVVALVGLAIGFTVPTLAQKDTVDPQIIEQFAALGKKYAEAVNNNDAAAVAALYTEDAVVVTETGTIYGREAIEKRWADLFKQVHFSNHIAKQYAPHIIGTAGNEMWGNGEWSATIQGKNWGPKDLKGYWGDVFVRQGDDWKILMDTSNTTPAPAATPSPTASPSNQ
jgi:ketosteroid isomerase-like protein